MRGARRTLAEQAATVVGWPGWEAFGGVRIFAGALTLVAASAAAQEVDGHGAVPPLFEPGPRAPVTVQAPWHAPRGAWSAIGLVEYADSPVVLYRQTSPQRVDEVVLLDDVVSLDLAGRYAILDRLGVGVVAPIFLGSSGSLGGGPAVGDVHVWVPVGLVLPDPGTGRGFGMSLVPSLSLPTGAAARLLGDRTLGGGLAFVIGHSFGPLSLDLNLGVEGTGAEELPSQQVGGAAFAAGAGLGIHPADTWSLHLESRASGAFSDDASVAGTPDGLGDAAGAPAEVLLTFKADLPGKTWGAAGLGGGVSNGVGAARLRGYLGVGLAHTPVDADVDAVASGFALRVLDPSGVPVVGAEVWSEDERLGVTAGDGVVPLTEVKWRRGVEVRGPYHETVALSEPAEDQTSMDVTLPWRPIALPVRVQDQGGQSVPATLTATRTDDPSTPPARGDAGTVRLTPGAWRVEVAADGFATQARSVVVDADGRPPGEIEVVLSQPAGPGVLALQLADPEGAAVEGARVLIDGQPVGTSGGGGLVEVHGLAEGAHDLAVLHDAFTTHEQPDHPVAAGNNDLPVVLRRVPGSVKVMARGPGGRPVPDAVVRFDGPTRLPPAPLGSRGERIQVLGPGEWNLMVTSAEFGVQARAISVPEDSWELIVVEVRLQPGEQGNATLSLRVVDVDGHPLEGVEIRLDEKELGATSTGGVVKLMGLDVGPRRLALGGEGLRDLPPIDLFLVEGLQERVVALSWQPGTVQVTARHPGGPVDDAVLRWIGGSTLPPAPLGSTGDARFTLADGTWTALATSALHGLHQAEVVVPPDSHSLQRVDLLMNPPEGGLAELAVRVVDPAGRPVEGAEVRLDGALMGRTGNTGGLGLRELAVGRRSLEVAAPMFTGVEQRVRLLEGKTEQEVVLDWAPGAARVVVRSGGQPVSDAILRLIGPHEVPPAPVDASGARTFALGVGTWQALAVSSEAGLAQGTLQIGATQSGLAELVLDIAPGAAGAAALLVRVIDPDGAPVAGAEVSFDGDVVGPTGAGGALLAEGLPPGPVKVTASHRLFTASEPMSATLVEGPQERIVQLAWRPIELTVAAKDTAGNPVDARVQLVGPVDQPAVALGADGEELVGLRPGAWQVIASTDALGPARAELTLAPGAEASRVELVLEASRVAMTGGAVVIKEQVQFDTGKATLRADSRAVLDQVANAILGNPAILRVEVGGHTDSVGGVPYNQALSQARAEAVLAALVERGVPTEKLVARGYGTQRPVGSNETDDGRAQNRRVAFEIEEQAAPAP